MDHFLQPALYEVDTSTILTGWREAKDMLSPRSRLILSETATTGDGGCHYLSNSFAAGFFWVNNIGLVASLGFWQMFRQDLVGFSGVNEGSSYALAGDSGWVGAPSVSGVYHNRTVPLEPNPDFYTSILYKRLMGKRYLSVGLEGAAVGSGSKARLRAHATCARGAPDDIALAFINGDASDVEVALPLSLVAESRVEYRLSPGDAMGLTSRRMKLNGRLLSLGSDLGGESIVGKVTSLVFPAQSYGFFVLRGVAPSVCAQ